MIYSFERTSEPILTNPLIHKVGGLKWCGKGTYVRTLSVDTGKN